MTPLFTKLNLGAHRDIVVLNAPDSFEADLTALDGVTIRRDADALPTVPFALAFVRTLGEVEVAAAALAAVEKAGFERARQVAIAEDWSRLRFRRVEHVKKRIRDQAWPGR